MWESSADQDGDGRGVFGQRYDSGGARLGTEFQVNSYTTGFQYQPDLACLDDGGFVVVWNGLGDEPTGYGIHGRRFDSAGAPATGDFDVSPFTDQPASVAGRPGAGFVVAFQQEDSGYYEVQARRFASSGAPVGSAFLVNADTTGRVFSPRVDTDPAGNFVIVWERRLPGFHERVSLRRYDSGGAPLGTEFDVSAYTTDYQQRPDVSVADDGRFVVAWTSNGGDYGVGARRFDSAGTPLGSSFQVNTPVAIHQYYSASVDHDAAGNFVVAWTNFEQTNYEGYAIFGRRFDSAGTPLGTEFQANTYTTHDQMYGRVAVAPSGDFVVAWVSRYQDGDDYGIFARRWVGCGPLDPQRTTLTWKAAGLDRFNVTVDFASSQPLDPAATDTLDLVISDGNGAPIWQSGPIPPGALWARSRPARHRFKWRDATATVVPGLTAMSLVERPFGSGLYRLTIKGKKATLLLPPPTAGTHAVSIGFSSGPCFRGSTSSCSKRPKTERCT